MLLLCYRLLLFDIYVVPLLLLLLLLLFVSNLVDFALLLSNVLSRAVKVKLKLKLKLLKSSSIRVLSIDDDAQEMSSSRRRAISVRLLTIACNSYSISIIAFAMRHCP